MSHVPDDVCTVRRRCSDCSEIVRDVDGSQVHWMQHLEQLHPERLVFRFRGHVYRPPFVCLCGGASVTADQFAFGRACGKCDRGACQQIYWQRRSREGEAPEYDGRGYELGHGRQDLIAAAPVDERAGPDEWCAAPPCVAHRAINMRELALRGVNL